MTKPRNIIAILRGVTPDTVEDITETLIAAGITKIEVPLNSPDAFTSISKIAADFHEHALIGAGTVLSVADVKRVQDCGGVLVVSPNMNPDVIRATREAGLLSYPGVMTPTECFAALEAGATGLKLFPGSLIGAKGLQAIRAVLPEGTEVLAVGGAAPENFAAWRAAGVDGFGIGTAVYRPGDTVKDVHDKAAKIVAAYDAAWSEA
ncbi:2-dehydro-3-deoxy-6-phosphogalactonate aldolase [Celeribacter litoreus]|uniref:2-dehydro-3-deoxy-6-phosphogalactonate aldolase n=1 Tax=Celeribacter litoreus TaxID=2876714 RepID=UPI001CCCB7D5|nr:2-dehydro-3-deoxy-6-phosphogalactonate aldolase [Celeribacter litoreus]MCA0044854.1 2-dehydro-3-deoxy-6-phosphogalactonate aldolase [Celeribacter litoreus]